jgi:hypothetical protein
MSFTTPLQDHTDAASATTVPSTSAASGVASSLAGLVHAVKLVELEVDRADGSSFALSICEDGCISDVKDKIEVLAGISSYKQTLYPAVATETGKRKREQGPCAGTMKVTCLPSRKLPVDLIKRRAFVPIVKKGESNNPTASKFHGKVTSKTRCTKRQHYH